MSDSVTTIEVTALREEIAALRAEVDALKRANVLWGKKWVACGDSLTEGDYSKACQHYHEMTRFVVATTLDRDEPTQEKLT